LAVNPLAKSPIKTVTIKGRNYAKENLFVHHPDCFVSIKIHAAHSCDLKCRSMLYPLPHQMMRDEINQYKEKMVLHGSVWVNLIRPYDINSNMLFRNVYGINGRAQSLFVVKQYSTPTQSIRALCFK